MAFETTLIDINLLKENPDNPRTITEAKFQALVKSVKDFPQMLEVRPLAVKSDYTVLGGNMRFRAAKAAGMTKIPVIFTNGWTEAEQREFIIKDNVGFGDWGWDAIIAEWPEAPDWGLDIPDWALPKKEAVEDDYDIPDEIETDIVLGDLFEIGPHRLICGDSTKAEDWDKLKIGDGFCVFTSPPYNIGKSAKLVGNTHAAKRESLYQDDTDDITNYDELLTKSLANSIKYCEGVAFNVQPLANNKVKLLKWVAEFETNFNDIITWNKGLAQPAMAKGVCSSVYEWIVVFSNKKTRTIPLSSWRGTLKNVYDGPPQRHNEYSKHHAATFPVHLPTWVITELMNICKGVVDPFIGCGTTMVAAHQLNRKCYGIEIDPKYCQVIVDRMRKLDPAIDIKKNGVPLEFTGEKQVTSAIS